MKPPWWFCCGWWSPWCVLDVAAHVVFRNAGEVELPIGLPVDLRQARRIDHA